MARLKPGEDARVASAALNRAMVEADLKVFAIGPRARSLEGIYHDVSQPQSGEGSRLMLTALSVEARKLNRSLAAVLAIAAPSLIAVFAFFNVLRMDEVQPWEMWLQSALAIWAFFMLPMSVTALTALVAHMEHGPKTWDHLRALPLPRWKIYAAKAICVLGLVAMMSAAVLGLTWLAVRAGVMIRPGLEPTGPLDLAGHVKTLALMFCAGLLLVAIQLWTALRYASFVPRPRGRDRRDLLRRGGDFRQTGRLPALADAGQHAVVRSVAPDHGAGAGRRCRSAGADRHGPAPVAARSAVSAARRPPA